MQHKISSQRWCLLIYTDFKREFCIFRESKKQLKKSSVVPRSGFEKVFTEFQIHGLLRVLIVPCAQHLYQKTLPQGQIRMMTKILGPKAGITSQTIVCGSFGRNPTSF